VRKIVVSLIVALSVTGLLVGYGGALGLSRDVSRALSLAHYWLGLLFLVMFPLYAWDHIRVNRRWLRRLRLLSATGEVQAASGALLMLTGLVLMAYGVATWAAMRHLHHWLTYVLAVSLLAHYLARKEW
jgi:hypothetical protein